MRGISLQDEASIWCVFCVTGRQVTLTFTWRGGQWGAAFEMRWDLLTETSVVNKTAKKARIPCQQWVDSKPGITASLLQDTGYWESILLIQLKDLLLPFLKSPHVRWMSIFLHVLSFILPSSISLSYIFAIKPLLYYAEKDYKNNYRKWYQIRIWIF